MRPGVMIGSIKGWEIEFLAQSKAREPQPLWFHLRLEELAFCYPYTTAQLLRTLEDCPAFPSRTELVALEHDLRYFHQARGGRLMLDLHGPGHAERDSYFVVHADTPDEERALLRRVCQGANAHLAARDMQAIDFHEKPKGANTSAQAGLTSANYAHLLGMSGCTVECTYQGERNGRAYEQKDYAAMGESLVKAIAAALG